MPKTMNLKIEEREMLHNKVCSVLRTAILKGEFKAGEKLVQTDLAELIGVSRMPIREALRTLEMEGLVKIEAHKGAVVRTISKEDIKEIYDLRAVLEPMALQKSFPNFTQEDLNQLKKYHKKMSIASGEEYIEINTAFHQQLHSRCKSPRLLAFIETISHGFAQDTPEIIPGQIEKSNKEHAELMDALLDGDVTGAAQHLKEHIERSGKELIKSLETKDFD